MKKLKLKKKPVQPPAAPKKGAGTAGPKVASSAPAKTVEPVQSAEKVMKAGELKELLDQAEENEQTGRSLMEPAAIAKKKRGRPSNAEKAAREAEQPSPGPAPNAPPPPPPLDCTPACILTFDLTSKWICRYTEEPRMALHKDEIEGLGKAWGAVANQYLPAWLAQHANLVAACVITGQVGMRLNATAQELVKEKRAAQERQAGRSVPTQSANGAMQAVVTQ